MLNDALVEEYLNRIGASRGVKADLETLSHLQERQVMSVPFENLDYHLDTEIGLGLASVEKIVHRRRGGGCYETNPALGLLLQSLGFKVEILPGRVYRAGRLGPPMCHLVLRVDLGEKWLVDTGFGRNSRRPLLMEPSILQADPNGEYQLVAVPGGGYDVLQNGKPQYRFDDRAVQVDDFRPTLWWYRSCPDSPFMQDVFCSLPTADGRVTLKGRKLTIVTGTERVTEELADDAAVLAAYRKHFGIDLDRVPSDPLIPAGGTIGIQLD